MNFLTAKLTERLNKNDPALTEVSMRRLPLTEVAAEEIVSIVKALQHNTAVKSVDLSIPAAAAASASSAVVDDDSTMNKDNERIPNKHHRHQDSSYSYLLDMLNNNTGIDSLTVRNVESDDAWTALSTGLQSNFGVREVVIGDTTTTVNATVLSVAACEAVRDLLRHTSTIQRISLKCFSVDDRQCMEAVCTGLQANESLRELALQQIESKHFSLLLDAIAKTEAPLEKLSIINCDLDFTNDERCCDQQKVHPLTSLVSCTSLISLKELRITECILGSAEIAALCLGMEVNTTVQLLDLSGCDLLADACKPIADMLATNTPLRHLILQENILGDFGASLLGPGLACNSSLETLDLKANHMTSEGCGRLAEALQSPYSRVQSLSLSENAISDAGAAALGDMLRNNKHASILNVDACMISDVGIGALCRGLRSNSALKELNVSNNWCKEGGVVADMLSTNTTLESLDLSSCHVTDCTLAALLRSLKEGSNKTLKRLFLSFNAFGNAGAKFIADMMLGGSRLSTLSVQFNAFDGTGLRDIVQALASNTFLQTLFYWNGFTSIDLDIQLLDDMEHLLALNRAGRCAVTECASNKPLWADILTRAGAVYGPTALFSLLREMPELMESNTAEGVS